MVLILFDNPAVLSREIVHGGVALLWKYAISDFITPLETIDSDRIMGIKCPIVCLIIF